MKREQIHIVQQMHPNQQIHLDLKKQMHFGEHMNLFYNEQMHLLNEKK